MLTMREAKTLLGSATLGTFGLLMYAESPLPYLLALLTTETVCGAALSYAPTRVLFYNFFTVISPYQIDSKYLKFENTNNYEDKELQTACFAVLQNGIERASFRLAYTQDVLTFRGSKMKICEDKLTNPVQAIVNLISDPNCKLKWLELAFVSLTIDEVKKIFDNVPENSSLKEIQISYYKKHTDDKHNMEEAIRRFPLASKGITISYDGRYDYDLSQSPHISY